jgi:hypothetical protein
MNFSIVPVRFAPGLVAALEIAFPIRVRIFLKVPRAHSWGSTCAPDR